MTAERAVAVGEHGVLLARAAERTEGLELDGGRLPPPEAVVGEPQELPHRLCGGRSLGERAEDLARLLEALPFEGSAGIAQALLRLLDALAGHGLPERGVGRDLGV